MYCSYTTAKLAEWGVTSVDWPPESPDMNVIELVWASLKAFLRDETKPINKQELSRGIKKFWREKMTVDVCRKYITHIHKVIPEVIAQNGGPTKY